MKLFKNFKKKTDSNPQKEDSTKDIYQDWHEKAEKRDNYLRHQSELLQKIANARNRYKNDNDINALISVFEEVFIHDPEPCNSSQDVDLIGFYIKAGRNNDAWAYSNYLISNYLKKKNYDSIKHVRIEQAKLLKKEKRYEYAIEMFALAYLHKSSVPAGFNRAAFQKDIASCVKALGWEQDKADYIAYLIKSQVDKNNFINEAPLTEAYRRFLADIKK